MMVSERTDISPVGQQSPEGTVRRLAEEVTAGSPVYVVDVEVRGHAGARSVDVFVDTDDGVSIEQCAAVSRALGERLDAEEVFRGAYQLNVSSPGVSRPLALPRQYRRNVGRSLQVVVPEQESDATRTLTGKLLEADESGITLETSTGRRTDRERFPYDRIISAKVQLPW